MNKENKQSQNMGQQFKKTTDKRFQSLMLQIEKDQMLQQKEKDNLKVSLADDVEAINKAFKVSSVKDEDRNLITCNYNLNLKPINEALKKFAQENDYKGITIQRKKTLRGGKSTIYSVKLEDQREKIVQKILEVKGKKEQIQTYINGVIQMNKHTQMLTDVEINQLEKYQRDIATLTKDMIVYEEASNVKQQKNGNKPLKIPVDLVFVIDATGSMSKLYEAAKKKCKDILEGLNFEDQAIDLKFAFIAYRDHLKQITEQNKATDNPIHKVADFDTYENIYQEIASTKCTGGDDTPQAIHDGLMRVASLSWREDSHRYVYLIADSPPHGSQYHQNKCSDNYPNKCPCNITLQDVIDKYQQMKINFIFSTVQGGNTYITDSVFKAKFPQTGYSTSKINQEDFSSLIQRQIKQKYDKYKQILIKFNKLAKKIEIKRIEKAIDIAITLCQEQADIDRRIRLTKVYDCYRNQMAKASKNLINLKEKLQRELREAKQQNQPILGKATQLNKKIIEMEEHRKKNEALKQILQCYFESLQISSQASETTQFEDNEEY